MKVVVLYCKSTGSIEKDMFIKDVSIDRSCASGIGGRVFYSPRLRRCRVSEVGMDLEGFQIADHQQGRVLQIVGIHFQLGVSVLKAALGIAKPLGLSRYGPEQVRFLQYRPVLDNTALKTVFGYAPVKTSAEAFEAWRQSVNL